jgi:hypothetical protein
MFAGLVKTQRVLGMELMSLYWAMFPTDWGTLTKSVSAEYTNLMTRIRTYRRRSGRRR